MDLVTKITSEIESTGTTKANNSHSAAPHVACWDNVKFQAKSLTQKSEAREDASWSKVKGQCPSLHKTESGRYSLRRGKKKDSKNTMSLWWDIPKQNGCKYLNKIKMSHAFWANLIQQLEVIQGQYFVSQHPNVPNSFSS